MLLITPGRTGSFVRDKERDRQCYLILKAPVIQGMDVARLFLGTVSFNEFKDCTPT
jgi:hypothetical protein